MKNEIFILACFIPETGNEKGNKVGKIKLNPTHQRILEEMRNTPQYQPGAFVSIDRNKNN